MRLKEFEGKQIFNKYKISTPKGFIISNLNELQKNIGKYKFDEYSVKAQILIGKRGKLGGVKFTSKNNLRKTCQLLLNKNIAGLKVEELLVEEKHNLDKQFYLAITLSRKDNSYVMIYSEKGGAEIEEIASKDPKAIKKFPFVSPNRNLIRSLFKNNKYKNELTSIALSLAKIIIDYDAILVEINPLIVINNKLIALDSKIILDDNALYRHEELLKVKELQLSKLEKEAFHYGISFVELKGNIAVISNGAGLVMATLDLINYYGGKPANFLDIGAGAGIDEIFRGLNLLIEEKPKGILINVFAGMTKCDEIADGIVKFRKKYKLKIPFVVRMIGTNEEEAKLILKKENINMLDSMEDCVKKIVKSV